MQQDATAMTDVCFPWPPAGTSTLSSASSKRDPSKAAAVMNHAESCGIRKLWRTCSRLFTKNLSFWRCCVLNSVDFDITSSFRSLQIPMIFVHLLTRRPQSHSSVSGFQVSAPEIWSSCTKASVSECFRDVLLGISWDLHVSQCLWEYDEHGNIKSKRFIDPYEIHMRSIGLPVPDLINLICSLSFRISSTLLLAAFLLLLWLASGWCLRRGNLSYALSSLHWLSRSACFLLQTGSCFPVTARYTFVSIKLTSPFSFQGVSHELPDVTCIAGGFPFGPLPA